MAKMTGNNDFGLTAGTTFLSTQKTDIGTLRTAIHVLAVNVQVIAGELTANVEAQIENLDTGEKQEPAWLAADLFVLWIQNQAKSGDVHVQEPAARVTA